MEVISLGEPLLDTRERFHIHDKTKDSILNVIKLYILNTIHDTCMTSKYMILYRLFNFYHVGETQRPRYMYNNRPFV